MKIGVINTDNSFISKIYFIIFVIIFSICCCQSIYADCSQSVIDNFKLVENDFEVTYSYDKDNKQTKIVIYNPEPDKYRIRIGKYDDNDEYFNDIKFNFIDNNRIEFLVYMYYQFKLEIVPTFTYCDRALKEIDVIPPPEKGYSDDKLCEGIEEFILCDENYDKPISREEFEERVYEYKEKKDNNDVYNVEDKVQDNVSIREDDYKINIKMLICSGIFFTLLLLNIILNIKIYKRSRVLE